MCIATIKHSDSRVILDQVSFMNSTEGIRELLDHARRHSESAMAFVESTGNYWIRIHDMFEENGVETLLANPIETKAIAKARLKDGRVDSNVLVDLRRADLVPESYVPDKEHRELRRLARTRIDLVHSRTAFKEKVEAIMAKYEFTNPQVSDIFSAKGRA